MSISSFMLGLSVTFFVLIAGHASPYNEMDRLLERHELVPYKKSNHPVAVGRLYLSLFFLDQILQEEGIDYWITDGTLLGAMRHGGFIPWDQDADIHIFEKDIPRFLSLKEQLKEKGLVIHDRTRKGYYLVQASGMPFMRTITGENSNCNQAVILVVPMHYDSSADHCMPLFKITRKRWPYCYMWNQKDVTPFKDYRFGPITLKGPAYAETYLKRHYGDHVFDRIEGSLFHMSVLQDGEEFPVADYDFVDDGWQVIEGVTHDKHFLNGKETEGYKKLRYTRCFQ